MKTKIWAVNCKDYNYKEIKSLLLKVFAETKAIDNLLASDKQILLKANLVFAKDKNIPSYTNSIFLKAVTDILKEKNLKPLLVDTYGPILKDEHKTIYDKFIWEVADFAGIEFISLEKYGFNLIKDKNLKVLPQIFFPEFFKENYIIINLPKWKVHPSCIFTGAVKNVFGLTNKKTRNIAHSNTKFTDFSQALLDVYSIFKPALNIMDSVVMLEGNGPLNGKPLNLGKIIIGFDGVAVDAVAAYFSGFKPMTIPMIYQAVERQLGEGELKNIEILRDKKKKDIKIKMPFTTSFKINFTPKVSNFIDNLIKIKPFINQDKCTGCSTCIINCPQETISLNENQKAEINYEKCINCFCCFEFCPEDAISLKKNIFAKINDRGRLDMVHLNE